MLGLNTRKSLNDILSSFNKVLEDLTTLQDANGEKISENNTEIATLQSANVELVSESEQAGKVEKKLRELVS